MTIRRAPLQARKSNFKSLSFNSDSKEEAEGLSMRPPTFQLTSMPFVGTAATAAQAPVNAIQAKFIKGSQFLGQTDNNVPVFVTLSTLIDSYNAYLDNDSPSYQDYQDAKHTLQEIERNIFSYISNETANHRKLADIPHYAEIEALRKKAGEEHIQLVKNLISEKRTPVDFDGLDEDEIAGVRKLWKSIIRGKGKIKVIGAADHKDKMYSWLVKLIETPTGRALLNYLNQGDPDDDMTNVFLGDDVAKLPEGLAEQSKQSGGDVKNTRISEAQPLGASGEMIGPEPVTGDEDPREYQIAHAPDDFKIALLQGKKGVIHNGKRYRFNKDVSVGAFVTAFEGESKNENAQHHQIMTPGWLTMGHELGHVAHMRGGGTNMMDTSSNDNNPSLMRDFTGQPSSLMNAKWQNGEEFLTINNWENSIRADIGLNQRDSHIPYTAGLKVERNLNIMDQVNAHFVDPEFRRIGRVETFLKDLKSAYTGRNEATNLEDNQVYQDLLDRWNDLQGEDLDEEARQVKRNIIMDKFNNLSNRFQNRKNSYKNLSWTKRRGNLKRTWHDLKNRYALIEHECTTNIDAHIDLRVPANASLYNQWCNEIEQLDTDVYNFKP